MVAHKRHRTLISLLFALALLPTSLLGAIVQTGNVEPNVNSWNNDTVGYIGRTDDGTVLVDAGSLLTSGNAQLGESIGATGVATVTGAASKWTNTSVLRVGHFGKGSLTVADGGEVTTSHLFASLSDLLGNGTITVTRGAILDTNLLFNAAHGTQQSFVFGSGGTLSIHWSGGALGAGYQQAGSLTVADGVHVAASYGVLGYHSGSVGTAVVTGPSSHWANSERFHVGRSGSGTLTIESGGQVSSSLESHLGYGPGAVGTVVVTGEESMWNNSGSLDVGYDGSGSITIAAGGQLSNTTGVLGRNSGATGTALITGIDSKWVNSEEFHVGLGGNGTLTIEAGGQVTNTYGSVGASGTVTIAGTGSKWTNTKSLAVHAWGNGRLTVADGGEVVAADLYASLSDLSGNGIITATTGAVLDADIVFDSAHGIQQSFAFGSGGTLTVNWSGGGLGVGYKQSGSLVVADGVNVISGNGFLGYDAGAIATAVVTGDGSQWTSSSLYVGYSGNGTLTVEAGGRVSANDSYVGTWSGSTGAATVSGTNSNWSINGLLFVGLNGNGILTIDSGGQLSTKDAYLGQNTFNSHSTGTVAVTGAGSKWTNSGLLTVGHAGSGLLSITDGGLVSVAQTLTIDHQLPSDSFINMATGAMLALKGDADDSLTQFLTLVSGTDAIRYWDASLLDWSPLTAATYGTDYTLEYLTTGELAGYTLLTVGRVGDFDNDGDVDGRDFLAWQRHPHFGSLSDWQNAYGTGSLPASTAVPEPSCLAMALLLLILSRKRSLQIRRG